MSQSVLLQRQLDAIKDAGIAYSTCLDEASQNALENDKLMLMYFHDLPSESNNFINILCNPDVNSLFKSDFCVFISNSEYFKQEFQSIFGGEHEDVANMLYTCTRGKEGIDLVSAISVETPQEEILYDLYKIHESYQDEVARENDEIVEESATDYLKDFEWFTAHEYISIKTALDITVNEPVPYLQRILMIYMYKEGSALTKQINEFLQTGMLNNYEKLIIPIFWNISDKRYHKALKWTCQCYLDLDVLEETITSDEGGLFFFMPKKDMDKSTPRIFTQITSSDDYLSAFYFSLGLYSRFTDFQQFYKITDIYELEAIDSYLKLKKTNSNAFNSNPFKGCVRRLPLHDVTALCLEKPRKLLLLYFYREYSELTKTLNAVQHLLHAQQVVFLPWDITDVKRNRQLIIALQRTFDLKKMEKILQAQKSALFIFLPYGNTMVLHSVLEADASESTLRDSYTDAHQFFMIESELEDDDDDCYGPAAYQQIMCDQLGDRDFDCFQLDKDEGVHLRSKIGFAYYGTPATNNGKYGEKQEKQIDAAYRKIIDEASMLGENDKMLYISFMRVGITPLPKDKQKKAKNKSYKPGLDFSAMPLFGIRKCFDCPESNSPCRKFIDHIGRTYESWEDFLENNKYPKVMLIAPKNGKYTCDYRGHVQLEVCPSPACGIGVAVLRGFDIGFTVAGAVAGVVGVVTTSIIALPVLPLVAMGTGITVGVYSIVRSSMTIADRLRYGESMGLQSAEARGAYINIIAGSLGFTSAGATFAVAYMARSGANIGMATRAVVNGITIVNLAAGGTAIGNSAYDVIMQWNEDGTPNALALVQLTSSVLFFGHAVYNVQFAGTIIKNSQTNAINRMLDSLSSNRQRKTLLRLIETSGQRAGSTMTGNAEVIKYIRSLDNVSEVVGVLTRDTKMMSKNGVKYSVENGKIVFNGEVMNVNEFGNMSKVQRLDLLTSLPADSRAARPSTPVQVTKDNAIILMRTLEVIQETAQVLKIVFDPDMPLSAKAQALLAHFRPYIQRGLVLLVEKVLENIGFDTNILFKSLLDLYPHAQVPSIILEMVVAFYNNEVSKTLPKKARANADFVIAAIEKLIIVSTCSMASLIEKLVAYCSKWVVQEIINRGFNDSAPRRGRTRAIKNCDICGGKFYQS